MKMREFNLINGEGKTYRLTVSNTYTGFLGAVDGLGYKRSPEYQKIGTDYEEISDSIEQSVINGQIIFFQPHAYQDFTSFAMFCQNKDLTLYYQIPTGTFLRKGSVTKIEKSEGGNELRAKIEFTAKSLWYQEIEETIEDDELTVSMNTLIDSPCCLSFTGITRSNATLAWTQKLDNVQIMTGELDGVTIVATDTVYIRTDTNPYQIYKVSSGGTKTDLYDKSDFGTKRFPYLQKGENTFIVTGASKLTVQGRILYETV